MFRHSQPCSSPMWIQVKSLDLTGLRFISPKTAREIFLILTDYLQAIILEHLPLFLKNNSSSWTFNSVTLQSMNSKVCGHYCLYFALFRSRRVSMNTIVNCFSSNKRRNDFLVKRFIEKHFPLSLKYYNTHVNKQGVKAQFNKDTM